MNSFLNIVSFLERTAAQKPDQLAIVHLEQSITFYALDELSRRIGGEISAALSHEIRRTVGVYLPKCIDLIGTLFGILYSGNSFLMLDVKAPPNRNGIILNRIQPDLIVTCKSCEAKLREANPACRILLIDEMRTTAVPASADLPWHHVIDTDPLCILTTSGSTGTPKGVVLNHRSYIDVVVQTMEATGVRGGMRSASLLAVDFDVFIFEVCFMAAIGGTIDIIPDSYTIFTAKLMEYIRDNPINLIYWVPSILVSISQADMLDKFKLTSLKEIWFIGEILPTKHLNYWRRHLPDARYINFYGPTETAVASTYFIIDRALDDSEPIPIGGPYQNTGILVLNADNQPVRGDEVGELCIRGSSLAMGYQNEPDKTNAVFVQNPLNSSYPEKIYRTGDLVNFNANGELMFRGRADTMIKHVGFRIELADVEHAVNSLDIISFGCVLYNLQEKKITLFYEAEKELPIHELRRQIGTLLPQYMIPTVFVYMEKLPRNSIDKIDRVTLKNMLNANPSN